MKGFLLTVFLGLAVAVTGCGKIQSIFKFGSSNPVKNPQIQAFAGLGDVVEAGKDIQITLSTDEIFRKGSDLLSKAGMAKVDAIAKAILKYQGHHVSVSGYTDNTGTDMKNVKFSQRLANAIRKELMRKGIGASNVTAMGRGSAESAAANDNDADKAKNRRVVFEISAA